MCGKPREWYFRIPIISWYQPSWKMMWRSDRRTWEWPPEEIRERVDKALEDVNMGAFKKKAPHLLSGGQKQRIAIAGVVAMKPQCIIFDEPTAMLDPKGRKEIMAIIDELHAEGITVVLITHFMEETVNADRLIIMNEGRVLLDGAPAEVFKQRDLIRSVNLDVPLMAELSFKLRELGVKVPDQYYYRRKRWLNLYVNKSRTFNSYI